MLVPLVLLSPDFLLQLFPGTEILFSNYFLLMVIFTWNYAQGNPLTFKKRAVNK